METEVWIVTVSGPLPHKAAGAELFLTEEDAQTKAKYLTRDLSTEDCAIKFTAHRMLIRPAATQRE